MGLTDSKMMGLVRSSVKTRLLFLSLLVLVFSQGEDLTDVDADSAWAWRDGSWSCLSNSASCDTPIKLRPDVKTNTRNAPEEVHSRNTVKLQVPNDLGSANAGYVHRLLQEQQQCPNQALKCPSSGVGSLSTARSRSGRKTQGGYRARCSNSIENGIPKGGLKCKNTKSVCWVRPAVTKCWGPCSNAPRNNRTNFQEASGFVHNWANHEHHKLYDPAVTKCKTNFGRKQGGWSCPDGISHTGVMDAADSCTTWSAKLAGRKTVCTSKGHGHKKRRICTVQAVTHPNQASTHVGVLTFKRVACTGQKCHVWKIGRCIDVGKPIWGSAYNEHNTVKQSQEFAIAAEAILKAHPMGKIPDKHKCKDDRNKCGKRKCKDAEQAAYETMVA